MRIVVDALSIIPGVNAGGETYLGGFIDALGRVDRENEYLILLTAEARELYSNKPANFQFQAIGLHNRLRAARILFEQFMLPVIAKKWKADLVWFPANVMSLLLPWMGIRSALTIHDFSPGFYRRHFPAYMPARRKRFLAWLTRQSAKRATAIMAVSEFGRSEIHDHTGADPGKIHALLSGTPLGEDRGHAAADLPSKYDYQRPYVLVVGRTNKHKYVDRFVEVFAAVKHAHSLPHHLVIAGSAGSGHADVLAAIAATAAADFVHIAGYVDQADLGQIYLEADLFAMPSLYEGFGFPILEAMRHGVPCLLSNTASLPEVGGDAALYMNPLDGESMESALLEVLTNSALRRRLGTEGVARAAEFSWDATALKAVDLFRSLEAGNNPGGRIPVM
jgi:glycosyltransferase involved in cell wall biosynthesis